MIDQQISNEKRAGSLQQVTNEADFSNLFVAIPTVDQLTNPQNPWLSSHMDQSNQETLAHSPFTEEKYENLPSISPLGIFSSISSPLELVHKTCMSMLSSPSHLSAWHYKNWYNEWVIEVIQVQRSLPKEEFEKSLPKEPCLCALFQPWRCRRSLAKSIAAVILKLHPTAGLAEKIAIYTMQHALFRVGPSNLS